MKHHQSAIGSRNSIGFTLVELLVVITIIGILIALLLPAVQAAREAARRLQCSNQVKQLALGCMLHEETHGRIPGNGWWATYVGDPDKGFGVDQPGGWIYNILPYVEQQAFHDFGSGKTDTEKKAIWTVAAATPLAMLFCPSRRPAVAIPLGSYYSTNAFPFQNITYSTTMLLAHNDYAINAGDSSAYIDEEPTNGVSFSRSMVRIPDIVDGTSNTYLIGEKHLNPDAYYVSEDGGDCSCAYSGHGYDTCRFTYRLWPPIQDTPGYWNGMCFGSAHPNALNMAFCDGSVQSINYSINPDVHASLGNRDDGKPAGGINY